MEKLDKISLEGVSGGFVAANAARLSKIYRDESGKIQKKNFNNKIHEITNDIANNLGLDPPAAYLVETQLANQFSNKAEVSYVEVNLGKNTRGLAEGTINVIGTQAN